MRHTFSINMDELNRHYQSIIEKCNNNYRDICHFLEIELQEKQDILNSLKLSQQIEIIDQEIQTILNIDDNENEIEIENENENEEDSSSSNDEEEAKRKIGRERKRKNRLYKKIYKELTNLDDYSGFNKEHKQLVEQYLRNNNSNTSKLSILNLMELDKDKNKSNNTFLAFKSRINIIYKLINNINCSIQADTTINDFIDCKTVIDKIVNSHHKNKLVFFNVLVKLFSYHNEIQLLDLNQRKAFLVYCHYNNYYKNLSYIEKNNLEFKTVDDEKVKHLITEKSIEEKEHWIDYPDLINLFFENHNNMDFNEHFIISLLLFLPAERHCFKNLKVVKEHCEYDITQNILIIDDNNTPIHIILNDFKTGNRYNQIVINIDDYDWNTIIKTNIKRYMEINPIPNNEYLFSKEIRYDFGNVVKRAFQKLCGIPISLNILRKIWVSHNWTKIRNCNEMINNSLILGHNIQTELQEYVKI